MDNDQDTIVISIAVAVLASFLLVIYVGFSGYTHFFIDRFLGYASSAFLIMPIINIITRREDVVLPRFATFIVIGVIFLIVRMAFTKETVLMAIISNLEYIVAVTLISVIILCMKHSLSKELEDLF